MDGVPKYVSDFARAHRIELSKITAKDQNFGMTLIDVADWLRENRADDGDLIAASLTAQFEWNARGQHGPVSQSRPGRTATPPARGEVSPYARNFLAEKARMALEVGGIQPSASPPTQFAAGSLPAFTASGISPQMLLDVPWNARHALAAAPTQAEAYQIHSRCTTGNSAEELTPEQCAGDYDSHPGNVDYGNRVKAWHAAAIEAAIDEDAWFAQFDRPHGFGT